MRAARTGSVPGDGLDGGERCSGSHGPGSVQARKGVFQLAAARNDLSIERTAEFVSE
jgi:hypothetical protein